MSEAREAKIPGAMGNPSAEIVAIERQDDVTTTVIRTSEDISSDRDPAPATIWMAGIPRKWKRIIDLHKVIKRDGKLLTFETYDVEGDLPGVGEQGILVGWWYGTARGLVEDTSLVWVREKYPVDGDSCVHCPFTFTHLREAGEGYRSGTTWISVEAYERFIRDDQLRIRRKPR